MFCTGFIQQFSNSMVPVYLYYSTVPISIISLILGFIILRFGDKKKSSTILFSLTIAFFFLFASNLVLWIAVDANIQTFVWFLNQFDFLLLPLLSFFLFSEFIKKNETSSNFLKILILALIAIFIPIVLLGYNINYFDLYNCTVIETSWIVIYQNAVLVLSCLLMAYLAIKNIFSSTETRESKTKTVLLAVGLCSVLFSLFFTWNPLIFGYPDGVDQFGFIGAMIFLSIITYMVVKFKMFGMKLLATQALVWGLAILIGSQFFFIKVAVNFILTGITFVAIIIFGQLLIKSVKKEISQREMLEQLRVKLEKTNMDLEDANEKLKSLDKLKTEFLSLASHQLRSPLTAIRGYTSMLLEGDYGKMNDKQKEAIDRVMQSSQHLTLVVEDLLNTAKIEQGGMQYTMVPFDFEKTVRDLENDLSITAEKKGLKFSFETDNKSPYTVNGDLEKLRQVILNLTDNAIKYTKIGSIKIKLSKDTKKKKVRLSITDTGMGMTPEIKATLFKKFARGDGGKVDSGGSGLGLYLAKEIVEAHKGVIDVNSKGPGLGSTFFFELKAE